MARILFLSRSEFLGPRLVAVLSQAGYLIEVVEVYAEAQERIRALKYDGIVIDYVGETARMVIRDLEELTRGRVPLGVVVGTVLPGGVSQGPLPGVHCMIDKQTWREGTFDWTVLSAARSMMRERVQRILEYAELEREPSRGESWVDKGILMQHAATDSDLSHTSGAAPQYRTGSPAKAVEVLSHCVSDWQSMLAPTESPPPQDTREKVANPMLKSDSVRLAYEFTDETLRRDALTADAPRSAHIFLALATARHGWRWRIDRHGAVLTSEAPIEIQWEDRISFRAAERLLLHCEDGPAIRYRDGWGVYVFRGTLLRPHVIEKPDQITLDEIRDEPNAEVRRFIRERFGEGRYLEAISAKLIDVDSVPVDGLAPGGTQITRALLEDDEGRRFLVGSDGSTRRVYYMEVPAGCRTCQEAYVALSGRTGVRTIVQA